MNLILLLTSWMMGLMAVQGVGPTTAPDYHDLGQEVYLTVGQYMGYCHDPSVLLAELCPSASFRSEVDLA